MKNLKEQKAIYFLLILPALEGLLVFVRLITIQTDPKNSIILGFSKNRLVLIGFSLILISCLLFILINSNLRKRFIVWFYSYSQHLKWIDIYFVIIFILFILTIWIPAYRFGVFEAIFVRLQPLLIWFELIWVQFIIASENSIIGYFFTKIIFEQFHYVIQKLKEKFGINFFIPYVFIPLGVLAIYSSSFAYFSFRFLPEGVNYIFATSLLISVLITMVGGSLIFSITHKSSKNDRLVLNHSVEKITFRNILIILLPLTPVVQYILNNQDILSIIDSLAILIIFTIFAFLYIVVFPYIFRSISSTKISMILGLTFVFTITSMALLSHQYTWIEKGSFGIQLLFFSLVFLMTLLLFNLKDKRVLNIIIVFIFVSNSGTQLLFQDAGTKDQSNPIVENSLRTLVGERIPNAKPNIYLLVYDAYVANETMLAYGIDNSSQEEYLVDLGFELYPHTYTIGSKTLESMSAVLNASTDFYGVSRRAVSGDGIVQNLFKDLGYSTNGIFPYDYMFQGIGSTYDFSVPEKSSAIKQLVTAILVGEFRFEFGYNNQPRIQFIETKQKFFESGSQNPIFLYTHSDRPAHSQNSGACLPDGGDIEQFQGRLTNANLEMRQDIDTLTKKDPGAIIIVAGDHGPQLTKNCYSSLANYNISEISRLDIQDRYGSFLAIRWPTEDFLEYDDITVLQDLFPAIFAYIYKDPGLLEAKVNSKTMAQSRISGAYVEDGIIFGGINDKEPLFLLGK